MTDFGPDYSFEVWMPPFTFPRIPAYQQQLLEALMIPRSLRVDGIDRRTAKEMSFRPFVPKRVDDEFTIHRTFMPRFMVDANPYRGLAASVTSHDDQVDAKLHGNFALLRSMEFCLSVEHLAFVGVWRAITSIIEIRWRQMARYARTQWREFRRSCKQTRLEVGGWRPVPGGDSWIIEDDMMELL